MSFWGKIGSLFSGKQGEEDNEGLYLYVQCDNCGEKLRIRIDKQHDVAPDYAEEGTYFLRKEMMDSRCFQLMYAELRFDRNYNVLSRDINGGHFITAQEYEEEQAKA
ncbi:MAG: hypothetical protein ACE5NP_06185 [Anaerolineae bacterium]